MTGAHYPSLLNYQYKICCEDKNNVFHPDLLSALCIFLCGLITCLFLSFYCWYWAVLIYCLLCKRTIVSNVHKHQNYFALLLLVFFKMLQKIIIMSSVFLKKFLFIFFSCRGPFGCNIWTLWYSVAFSWYKKHTLHALFTLGLWSKIMKEKLAWH